MGSNIYIGIGSNLGDRLNNILRAKELMQRGGIKIIRESRIYETEPIGPVNQGKFLNGVIEISTSLTARELLKTLQEIGNKMGRVPSCRWGPRTIDLDILFYGNEIISEDGLQIPHPEIPKRKFVLVPLAEIAPDFVHLVLRKSISVLLEECPDNSRVELYETTEDTEPTGKI